MTVKRGDIYYADLSPVVGSEQGGVRPVLIVQNDVGNKYSPTVIAAAITTGPARGPRPASSIPHIYSTPELWISSSIAFSWINRCSSFSFILFSSLSSYINL